MCPRHDRKETGRTFVERGCLDFADYPINWLYRSAIDDCRAVGSVETGFDEPFDYPFHCAVFFLIVGQPSDLSAESLDGSPNLLLIFVDDLGYGDLGCYGNLEIETYTIDSFKRVMLTNFGVGSGLRAKSTGLMSGRHPGLIGDLRFVDIRSVASCDACAKATTAILGKWHWRAIRKILLRARCISNADLITITNSGSNDVPAPAGKSKHATFLTKRIRSLSKYH